MASENVVKIAPSILSADFSRLGEQVAEAEEGGADQIHVDVMDGHFVPNLTIGPQVVASIRRWTTLPLDVHVMAQEPGRFVPQLADAGADIITVHAEACTHLHRVVQQIQEAGISPGVAVNPATPPSALYEVLADLDQALVMTVNPGYGGQPFIESMVPKIARVRERLDALGLGAALQVDGGITESNAAKVVRAGARVLVAGSAVYNDRRTVAQSIAAIRSSIDAAL